MEVSAASRRTSLQLHRVSALLWAHVVEVKLLALDRAVKANFDPNQPRVPAGNPDGGQWTDAGGGGAGSSSTEGNEDGAPNHVLFASFTPEGTDEPPKVPKERPRSSRGRTRVYKELATWLARQVVTKRVRALLTILDQAGWLEPATDSIRTFGDPPKSLEELQDDVWTPAPGYDVHHIVEKTPALRDEYPSSRVNGPENLVRIPRLKHWIINAWLETPNENFDWETPRAYMRGKDWDIRYRIGLEALVKFGVLKK